MVLSSSRADDIFTATGMPDFAFLWSVIIDWMEGNRLTANEIDVKS